MSTAAKWQQKMNCCMLPVIYQIEDARAGTGRRRARNKFRSLEHFWYTVWNCALVQLCENGPTLVPCPQRWVTRTCYNEADDKINQTLVPDFIILRVAETRPSIRVRATNPRRRADILQKVVGIFEIKPSPESDTENAIWSALQKGRNDAVEQGANHFAGLKGIEANKKVVGMYAAGEYWTWELFIVNRNGVKPPSVHRDGTYRPSEEREVQPVRMPGRYYKLGEPESEEAMQEMLRTIFNLPGSNRFREE